MQLIDTVAPTDLHIATRPIGSLFGTIVGATISSIVLHIGLHAIIAPTLIPRVKSLLAFVESRGKEPGRAKLSIPEAIEFSA